MYFKESAGPIRGRVKVVDVKNKELTNSEEVMGFLVSHSKDIGIESEDQLLEIWKLNANKQYLCSWTMEAPEVIEHPVYIRKKDRRAWVTDYHPSEEVLAGFL